MPKGRLRAAPPARSRPCMEPRDWFPCGSLASPSTAAHCPCPGVVTLRLCSRSPSVTCESSGWRALGTGRHTACPARSLSAAQHWLFPALPPVDVLGALVETCTYLESALSDVAATGPPAGATHLAPAHLPTP